MIHFFNYWTWQVSKCYDDLCVSQAWHGQNNLCICFSICFSSLFWHVSPPLVLLLAIISHVSAKLGPITQCLKWESIIFASLPWGQVSTELIWRFPKIQTWNSPNLSEVTSSVTAHIDCLSETFSKHLGESYETYQKYVRIIFHPQIKEIIFCLKGLSLFSELKNGPLLSLFSWQLSTCKTIKFSCP